MSEKDKIMLKELESVEGMIAKANMEKSEGKLE